MPHIKVKNFDTSSLDVLVDKSSIFEFRAIADAGDGEILGVRY